MTIRTMRSRSIVVSVGLGAAVALSAPAQAAPTAADAGFVEIHRAVPDALVDLRYAGANNFTGRQLYPTGARCLVHQSLAPGLATAAATLRAAGARLVFWDCYRPHSVQVTMFEVVSNPNWVARPGSTARSHTAGRSVDVTLADAAGRLVDMGTDFDSFTPPALAYATDGVTAAQRANRALLREAMAAGGLTVYSGEWWHFDGPGAAVDRPIIEVPLT